MFAFALGCGGDGGADPNAKLNSLSVADQMAECNHLASEFPPKTVDCGAGSGNPTVGTDPSQCSGSGFQPAPSTCTITVGDLETCDSDLYNEGSALCAGTVPQSCAGLFSSDCGGQ